MEIAGGVKLFLAVVFASILVSNGQVPTICGGILNQTTGTLESSNFPYPTDPKINCVWEFDINITDFVYLTLETVELGPKDTVSVYDGTKDYNFTGHNLNSKTMFILSPKKSKITFSSGDGQPSVARFQADFTAKPLGQNIIYANEDYFGVIKSPYYSVINAIAEYTWVITQKPQKNIYLAFKKFNISETSFLTIEDETQKLNFSGSSLPNDIVTSSQVKITSRFSLGESDQDFEIFYSYLYPNCSSAVNINDSQKIHFYGIPSEYPVRCFTVVEGPENSILSATVSFIQNVTDNDFTNVIVSLGDGGSMFSPVLLANSPANREEDSFVVTKTNKLWIGYTYPSSTVGVNATVTVSVLNQGGIFYKPTAFGLQSSPNSTLHSNESVYVLTVPHGEQIVATVFNTTLVAENRISFYDGGHRDHLVAVFTNDTKFFYPVVSTHSEMIVVAENFGNTETFNASFVSSPKGYNQLTTGNFGSFQVEKVFANSSRFWVIEPKLNSSELIVFTITKAVLSKYLELCIYEGPTNESKRLYHLSDAHVQASSFYIPSEKGALVTLCNTGDETEDLLADLSFQLQPTCNLTVDLTSSVSGMITSPNYPNAYPTNAECEWHIVSDKALLFNFQFIDLPPSRPVLFYSLNNNQSTLLYNISGSGNQQALIVNQSHVMVNWSSIFPMNNFTGGKGFQLEVTALDCGGIYNGTIKEFSTPGYPNLLKNRTLCAWLLDLPPKEGDKTDIVMLSFTSTSAKSSSSKLTIYDGSNTQSQTVNITEKPSYSNYLSRTSQVLITYDSVSNTSSGTAYAFTYSIYACDQMCKNGICLHDDWRCNGINECGDFTDEAQCAAAPIVQESGGVSVTTLVVSILLCLTIGAVGAFALPIVWKRYRGRGGSYQEFRNSVDA